MLRLYRKTRIPWVIFAPLALFLCIASATGRWPFGAAAWCQNGVIALCLVVQFRLWDDLADVESDRIFHPGRVLCQTKSHQYFWGVLGLLLAVNTVLIVSFKSFHSLGVFLILIVFYYVWYALPRQVTGDTFVTHSIGLVKYPVFVFLLSGPHIDAREGLRLTYAMIVTFLCFCAYELQHDQRLRSNRHATSLLACEFFSLLFVATLMLIELRRNASILAFVQVGLLAVGSIALVSLFQLYRVRTAPGFWHFGVFFVVVAWLLNFALGSRGLIDPPRSELSAKSSSKIEFPTGASI